jgi:hypothetical protein
VKIGFIIIVRFTPSDELVNQRAKQIYEVDQSIELSVRMKLKNPYIQVKQES